MIGQGSISGIYSTGNKEFVPVKAGTNNALTVMLLDGSSSMESVKQPTISGFNEFLIGQQSGDIKTNISLYSFHGTGINTIVENKPSETVAPLNAESYRTEGMTNLNDAIGLVMEATNRLLASIAPEQRPSIIITIFTDGEENTSRVYNTNDIKRMVSRCEEADWVFMFMGANIDAFAVSNNLGFNYMNTVQYDTHNMGATMSVVNSVTARYKDAKLRGLDTSATYATQSASASERDSVV